MNEHNTTQTEEIIKQFDINFFPKIQRLLNDFYQNSYASNFSELYFDIPTQANYCKSPIENFSRRGIRRIKMTIGLTNNTSSRQIEQIILEIKTMLQNHKSIAQKELI